MTTNPLLGVFWCSDTLEFPVQNAQSPATQLQNAILGGLGGLHWGTLRSPLALASLAFYKHKEMTQTFKKKSPKY